MNSTDLIAAAAINATNYLLLQNGLRPIRPSKYEPTNLETLVHFDNKVFGEGDYKVEFDYIPAQPEVLYPIDRACPAYGAEISLCSVMVKSGQGWIDVLPILCAVEKERIEQAIAEDM